MEVVSPRKNQFLCVPSLSSIPNKSYEKKITKANKNKRRDRKLLQNEKGTKMMSFSSPAYLPNNVQNDWLADNAGEEWKWREDLDGEDGWWCLDDGKGSDGKGRKI